MRAKSITKENISVGIKCLAPWRLTKVKPLPDYTLEVTFVDELHGFVKMHDFILGSGAGVFAVLKDVKLFNQVYLEFGALTWPGEIDLAPDAMHHEIKQNGTWIL